MKIAFLKGKGILDRLIQIWTLSKYSHCEMVFTDGMTVGTSLGMPFTVTKQTNAFYSPGLWDMVEVKLTPDEEEKVKKFALEQVGKKYDWMGIYLSQILPFRMQKTNKWFCSELCVASLQQVGKVSDIKPCRVSPGKLSKML